MSATSSSYGNTQKVHSGGNPVGSLFLGVGGSSSSASKFLLPGVFLLVVVLAYVFVFRSTTPQIKYGLMFDAGSTGSRIHVYSFDSSGKLLDEIFKEVKPGLSSYANAQEAAASLQPLLNISLAAIPEAQRKCTPLALKATAGLRRLGKDKAEKHLQAVRDLLATYPFYTDKNAVEIMSGTDEAAFAWITINHLLGRLDGENQKTVSVMDLGGGSTQIVFEPERGSLTNAPKEVQYEVQVGPAKRTLYQHSYDGWGLNAARSKIFGLKVAADTDPSTPVTHPCIPPGHEEVLTINDKKYRFTPADDSSFLQCEALAKKILNKEAACQVAPCSFNGVHQPPLGDPAVFNSDIYAISYFFDRTQIDDPKPELTVGDFKARAEAACKTKAADKDHGVLCADLSYMYALLAHGYSLKDDQKLQLAKKINGFETAWSLGAMVVLLKNVDVPCA